MKVHRIVLYVIDFEGLGADNVCTELKETSYANDCISPKILDVQTRDIGEWSDDHPLNKTSTVTSTIAALFAVPA